ncbi:MULTISPECIES: SIS domain-containing protein [Acidianus]|uniref:Sugar isomerase n=1 Tax=Candidatus Acidianus copahuensis TaxID=1160895 RepID=A0A031LUM5_9CREN|nr:MULTISPECIES: SIS domain-containing protein [Acidianus]EZQ10848.1 sugar isomerase [Candidatus Acidianus copahuensis]NON61236.1 SIS domain-containing protein [Acidianus sp. RZ1]
MELARLMEKELNSYSKVSTPSRVEKAYVTGAGDSYAAALSIQGKTNGRFIAIDPYEAMKAQLNMPLIVLSVSGKPKTNIELVKKFKGRTKIIAITANRSSQLATLADETIDLPYRSSITLPGSLSFLLSLSALYSLAGEEEDEEEPDGVVTLDSSPFFVGSNENYGIAYFAYLKLAEIFGRSSNYERLEQFCHSPIFSTRKRQIFILSSGDKRERDLSEGIDFTEVHLTPCMGAFCNAKFIIKAIIETAKKERLEKPFFLSDKKILDLSSKMIY